MFNINEFRQWCADLGFNIEEREIEQGIQYLISAGQECVSLNLYHTGRTLVQGKQTPLKTTIDTHISSFCALVEGAENSIKKKRAPRKTQPITHPPASIPPETYSLSPEDASQSEGLTQNHPILTLILNNQETFTMEMVLKMQK